MLGEGLKTTKVYISGPISGKKDGNQSAFYAAAIKIIEEGAFPVNPHDVTHFLPPGSSWVAYMKADIPALCEADEIYMLRGWWRSRGARLEWVIARGLGYKVRYENNHS